jgi:hypothetical protein
VRNRVEILGQSTRKLRRAGDIPVRVQLLLVAPMT